MAGYDLKTALQKLGKKRMNFGLYRGADADQVLITSKAASAKQVEEMEKECGEVKRLLKGVVFQEDGGTVFATKAIAQPMYEKIIAAIFKERKCGGYLPISLRQLSAQDSDEVTEDVGGTGAAPGASTAPAPVAPAPGGAKEEWDRLKAELIPRIKSALANAALKEPLTNLVREALGQEKAGAYPAAIAVFRKARQMLGGGPTPGDTASPAPVAPPPPPPPPPAPPARKRHSPRILQAALNKLTPQIKRALAANPDAREQILRPVADMQKQFKAGDTAAAQASLVKLTARLKSFGAFSSQAAS